MKGLFKKVVLVLFAGVVTASMSSCEDDNDDSSWNADDELCGQVVAHFVDNTVLPTYKSLAESAIAMRKAIQVYVANPSEIAMEGAANAWMTARVAWEMSEGYLFGPVGEDNLSIDPHIDSWPLELNDIETVLAKITSGNAATYDGEWAWDQDGEVIGFHVTEWLLYREGKPRAYNALSAAERIYLVSATDALVWDCVMAYIAWMGEENVSAEMKVVFNENPKVVAHLKNNPAFMNYAKNMKSAHAYPSIVAAMQEIPSGCSEIADEVGATKIEAPYKAKKTEDVESWYSWHSLDDYSNNIRSIKNAYLGGVDDNSRPSVSLSTYVANNDEALDQDIKNQIEDCITKIKAIGGGSKSFYEVVRDQINAEQVEEAVNACVRLKQLMDMVHDQIR